VTGNLQKKWTPLYHSSSNCSSSSSTINLNLTLLSVCKKYINLIISICTVCAHKTRNSATHFLFKWAVKISSVTTYSFNSSIMNTFIFMIRQDTIYLLNAIGLTPGVCSTVHIYTQRNTMKQNTQNRTYITIGIHRHNNKNT